MFCGRCGNRLPGQGNFCNVCGAPLQPEQLAPRRRKRAVWPWIVVGVLVAGLGGGAAFVALRGGSEKPRPPPVVGKPDTENLPPRLVRLSAGAPRVEVGGSTALTATITDPEHDRYYAWWSASCGVIAPRAGEPGRALFLAPATPGPCAITVEIQDHELRRSRRHQYTVMVEGGG